MRVKVCPVARASGVVVLVALILSGFLTPAQARNPGASPDPGIAAMMAQVNSDDLVDRVKELSGALPAIVGGAPYTFTTRSTTSGMPIQKATQFGYEFLQAQGLTVSYHNWNGSESECGISNRNVVAEKRGAYQPDDIVLVTAHIDSITGSGVPPAPGADDDASGSVGVMATAQIMASRQFSRTVRFILFSGEEQGGCGSTAYANAAAARHDHIVAVYNMDMIAYDSDHVPDLRLHTRRTSNSGYAADLAIANTFVAVVSDYGLGEKLTPILTPDGVSASDHSSFWSNGYAGILAIEDDYDDFNPYYHSANDTPAAVNPTYFTNFVKASVGTAARLAGLVQPSHSAYVPLIWR